MRKNPQATSAATVLGEWYAGYWSWIEQNSDVIRVTAYANTDWDAQTQWQCANGAPAAGSGASPSAISRTQWVSRTRRTVPADNGGAFAARWRPMVLLRAVGGPRPRTGDPQGK
ncbi:hypothetical protein [Streptomyces sp. NPDC001089]